MVILLCMTVSGEQRLYIYSYLSLVEVSKVELSAIFIYRTVIFISVVG